MHWLDIIVSGSIGIVLTIIASVITRTSEVFKAIESIWSILVRKKTSFSFEKESKYFNRTSNPRFQFSFMEILSWDKQLPVNGDGNTFIHPDDQQVVYKIWGMHNVLHETDDLEEIVADVIRHQNDNIKLIMKKETSLDIIEYTIDEEMSTIIQSSIPAYRLAYVYKEERR